MDEYQSGDDHELLTTMIKQHDIFASLDNVFKVDPSDRITFKVGQKHDKIYTLRDALQDYAI